MRLARPAAFRPRPAFTLVEVLVAVLLVATGLLGIAGAPAYALRMATAATRERNAVHRAASRLATVSAAGCGRAASGALSVQASGMRERWVVSRRPGIALTEAQVEWRAAGGPRSLRLEGALLC
jgi:prepilin-type N-terminal cleavage/methylation domain-containing protein